MSLICTDVVLCAALAANIIPTEAEQTEENQHYAQIINSMIWFMINYNWYNDRSMLYMVFKYYSV